MALLWGKSMCEFGEEMEEPLLYQGSAIPTSAEITTEPLSRVLL